MTTENLSTLKINKLTQTQYDREVEAGTVEEDALYLTPDEAITVAKIADLTVTATELNHMDGIKSNVQTQLDEKISLDSHGYVIGLVASDYLTVANAETSMELYVNGLGSNTGNVWIDESGEAWLGKVYVGSDDNYKELATQEYVDNAIGAAIGGSY